MTRSHGKRDDPTVTFLKEASALIELVDLVDRFRLPPKKPKKCSYEFKETDDNESRRHRQRASRQHRDSSGHARAQVSRKSLKLTVQYKSRKHNKSARKNSRVICCTTKSGPLFHSGTKQSKGSQKRQIKTLQLKMNKDIEDLKAKLFSIQCKNSTNKVKKNTRTTERKMQNQLLYDLDKMNYVRIYSLKDDFKLGEQGKLGGTPGLLPKADYPKFDLTDDIPNFILLNNESLKRNTRKRVKEKKDSTDYEKKEKQSLHLTLSLRIKPDSNKINLEVKTKRKSCKSNKHEPKSLDFCLPDQCDSASPQEQMNRLLMSMLTRKLSKSSTEEISRLPLMKTFSSDSLQLMKQQEIMNTKFREVPSTNTQAVYNLYNISAPQFPIPQGGDVRVLKSNLHFNLNIGRGPKTEQISTSGPYTPSGRSEGKEFRYKSKVDYGSGTTSLQQSFSVGRKPQPVEYFSDPSLPCDCEPFECDPSLSSLEQTGSSTCPTCCQYEEPVYVPPEKFNYITTLKRCKQRIMDRVANVRDDASVMITSPRKFIKNVYDKHVTKSKFEPAEKDVGSCTCYPFIDTEQVSVIEKNIRPDCSFWQRIFGDLLFSDKCVVCNKQTEVRKKNKFACGPGICIEATGISACVGKWFNKCVDKCKKKPKKKKKEEKGSPICRFMCKIFCGVTDEDRKKLLKKKAKIKKHKERQEAKRAKKAGEDPSKFKSSNKYVATGRRQFRRATRRIREKYYRNKKLAEQQKGRFACDFYLMSLRNKPCLWVYYMCPYCYPYCLQALSVWRQVSDLLLFFVAIVVWSPCILCAEMVKVMMCNFIA